MEPSSAAEDERTAAPGRVPPASLLRQRRPAPEEEDAPSSRRRRKQYRDAGGGGAFWAVIAAVALVGYVGVMAMLNWRLSSELARDRQACSRMVQRTVDDRDAALHRLRGEMHSRTAEHALMIQDRDEASLISPPSDEDDQ
ncbi:hypothetical protein T484DRAFT_1766869, partial [Baffinella frigidus]